MERSGIVAEIDGDRSSWHRWSGLVQKVLGDARRQLATLEELTVHWRQQKDPQTAACDILEARDQAEYARGN